MADTKQFGSPRGPSVPPPVDEGNSGETIKRPRTPIGGHGPGQDARAASQAVAQGGSPAALPRGRAATGAKFIDPHQAKTTLSSDVHARETLEMQAPLVASMVRDFVKTEDAAAISRQQGLPGAVPFDPAPPRAPSDGWNVAASSGVREEILPRPSAPQEPPPLIDVVKHEIPPGVQDPRLVILQEPDSTRASAFRVLRHHVLERGRPRVIGISSPNPGEGKTTCAVNLALALAESGRARVLLVDGHIRKPQISNVLRFVPPKCMIEQLAEHRKDPALRWTVVELDKTTLHVMAINPRTENRVLLDGPGFAAFIQKMRRAEYDHIVIDGPQVSGSADANLIQDVSNGIILLARAKKTTARHLRVAMEQLSSSKILGFTLLE